MKKVRDEFGSRIGTITDYFTYDAIGNSVLKQRAIAQAQAQAQKLAQISGADDLRPGSVAGQDTWTRILLGDAALQDPFRSGPLAVPDDVPQFPHTPWAWSFPAFGREAVVSADRPELYVVGAAPEGINASDIRA